MEKHGRVYVCHTYYHVFVAYLKELNLENREEAADMVISTMSTDFESFPDRVKESGVFRDVILFDEKRESEFPDLLKYREDKGNIVSNMISRIKFTKKFAKALEPYVPVDFSKYKDVYVFCDTDPVGYYLNYKHIYYHAVEDGLDTLSVAVYAKYDNRGHFGLKKFLSKKCNLIFIRDGYGKYCLDMEVNDLSVIDDEPDVYKEVPRNALMDALGEKEKEIIIRTFVRNYDELIRMEENIDEKEKNILILTEPLTPSFDTREKIFRDLVCEYEKEGRVFLKPHPRDSLDYPVRFADVPQFDRTIPMEIFNFFDKIRFGKIVSVYTQLGAVRFAKEKVTLGDDFMDKYEDPAIHRKREVLDAEMKKG